MSRCYCLWPLQQNKTGACFKFFRKPAKNKVCISILLHAKLKVFFERGLTGIIVCVPFRISKTFRKLVSRTISMITQFSDGDFL